MWQAIAEVVKQGMKNIANSGKNAQVNGSTTEGGVGLINPDFKKSDTKLENKNDENSISQTTENTTKVETTKQEEPVESNEVESSSGIGGLGNLKSLVGGATVTSDVKNITLTVGNQTISKYGTITSTTITANIDSNGYSVPNSLITWSAPDTTGYTSAASMSIDGKTASLKRRLL